MAKVATKQLMKHSLSPVVGKAPKILILGTAPGDQSLKTNQYYDNSNNHFWSIIEKVLNGGNKFSDYLDKIGCLKRNHIALWDVYENFVRKGSSDTNLKGLSINDFKTFIQKNSTIRLVISNGTKAADEFRKLYLPVPVLVAPSTSSKRPRYRLSKNILDIWEEFLLNYL